MEFPGVTRTTQAILDLAEVEAQLLHQRDVHPVHVFLAMLVKSVDDNHASRILHEAGIELSLARETARSFVVVPELNPPAVYEFDLEVGPIVDRAVQIANKNDTGRLARPEHLLQALLEFPDDVIDQIFVESNYPQAKVLIAAFNLQEEEGD